MEDLLIDESSILDKVETRLIINEFIAIKEGQPKYLSDYGDQYIYSQVIKTPIVEKKNLTDKPKPGMNIFKPRFLTIKNDESSKAVIKLEPSYIKTQVEGRKPSSHCVDDDLGLEYKYASEFEAIKARTLGTAEDNSEATQILSAVDNLKAKVNIHTVMFVFGITGSGKDNFLNLIYGKLLNNDKIHDNKDNEDVNYIKNVFKNNKEIIKEDWYYINNDNGNSLSSISKEYGKEYDGNIETDIDNFMVAQTPFNPQSTRGFNIKNIKDEGQESIFTIINVPGFEPLHNILMLHILGEKEVLYNTSLKITNNNFYRILEQVLNPTTGFNINPKYEHILKILNQSCYILQNLNMMGAILTHYKEIRDEHVKTIKIDTNITNKSEELFEKLFKIENELITKVKIVDKLSTIKKNTVSFPDDPKLDFLKPFYKENGKFVCFKGGNPIFEKCLKKEENKFIVDLLDNLFFAHSDKRKTRYNINVIRPLRHILETGELGGIIQHAQFTTLISSLAQQEKEKNGGSEKVMLDNTLIGTLEGFCNIQKGDT